MCFDQSAHSKNTIELKELTEFLLNLVTHCLQNLSFLSVHRGERSVLQPKKHQDQCTCIMENVWASASTGPIIVVYVKMDVAAHLEEHAQYLSLLSVLTVSTFKSQLCLYSLVNAATTVAISMK